MVLLQDALQPFRVETGLLEQLFDARLVLLASHAGSDGNEVLGAEDFGRHALEFKFPALYSWPQSSGPGGFVKEQVRGT
jgi:hypothetical protein